MVVFFVLICVFFVAIAVGFWVHATCEYGYHAEWQSGEDPNIRRCVGCGHEQRYVVTWVGMVDGDEIWGWV